MATWRREDGLRDAEMRGVPGVVGACEVDDAAGNAVGGGLGWALNVDVEAVAWWVGWRYGERWVVVAGKDRVRASSLTDRPLSVSPSSPLSIVSNKPGIALAMLPWWCFRCRTRLAIAEENGEGREKILKHVKSGLSICNLL